MEVANKAACCKSCLPLEVAMCTDSHEVHSISLASQPLGAVAAPSSRLLVVRWLCHMKLHKAQTLLKQVSHMWRDENEMGLSSKNPAVMAKAGTPAEPSPAQPTSYERMAQPSFTATTDVMGTRREQVPESFLRQSVPIKVRVTVGELKQNQELQRNTEKAGEGKQGGWGGVRGAPRDDSHH